MSKHIIGESARPSIQKIVGLYVPHDDANPKRAAHKIIGDLEKWGFSLVQLTDAAKRTKRSAGRVMLDVVTPSNDRAVWLEELARYVLASRANAIMLKDGEADHLQLLKPTEDGKRVEVHNIQLDEGYSLRPDDTGGSLQ